MPRTEINARSALKFWVGTLNNYDDQLYDQVIAWADEHCDYYIVAKEIGASGTRHLQTFFAMKRGSRLSAMRGHFNGRFHWEGTKGTGKQASDYCKKGEQSKEEWEAQGIDGPNFGKNAVFVEKGTVPSTVRGNPKLKECNKDYADAVKHALAGKLLDIRPDIFIRNYGNLVRIQNDFQNNVVDLDEPKLFWFYSPQSGTGKSTTARAICQKGLPPDAPPRYYLKDRSNWWDGYDANSHPFVIFDDFDYPNMGADLKVWTDKFAFNAQMKGYMRRIRPKAIIITSNRTPSEIWNDYHIVGPINRRIIASDGMFKFTDIHVDPLNMTLRHNGDYCGDWVQGWPRRPSLIDDPPSPPPEGQAPETAESLASTMVIPLPNPTVPWTESMQEAIFEEGILD